VDKVITEVLPSAHWLAMVIVLECGHRHVRPASWPLWVGDQFDCCFCDDAASPEAPQETTKR
jgi:hypothetical protein